MSRWPELAQEPGGPGRRDLAGALGAVVTAGVVGWILVFAGMGFWGLIVGVAVAFVLLVIAPRDRSAHGLGRRLAFGVAFMLLTWPVLWLRLAWRVTGSPATRSAIDERHGFAVTNRQPGRPPAGTTNGVLLRIYAPAKR